MKVTDLLDTAYELDGDETEWLRSLAKAAELLIGVTLSARKEMERINDHGAVCFGTTQSFLSAMVGSRSQEKLWL